MTLTGEKNSGKAEPVFMDKTNIFESEHLEVVKSDVDFDPAAATKAAENVMGPNYLNTSKNSKFIAIIK